VKEARTVGLGYRTSPKLEALDTKSSGYQNVAPWGSQVKGSDCGPDWIKVGARFLPRFHDGFEVLTLIDDRDADDSLSNLSSAQTEATTRSFIDVRFMRDLLLGPEAERIKLWNGCTAAERSRRIASVFKRSAQTLLGTSIAGVVVGCGMVPLRMQALSQIGLASLCASLTLPPVVIGLLPVLIALGLGPTRIRRRIFLEFAHWVAAGRPQGVHPDVPGELKMSSVCSSAAGAEDDGHDWRAPGEIAAEELGFPYTLTLRSMGEHCDQVCERFPCLRKQIGGEDEEYDKNKYKVADDNNDSFALSPNRAASPSDAEKPAAEADIAAQGKVPDLDSLWDTPAPAAEQRIVSFR